MQHIKGLEVLLLSSAAVASIPEMNSDVSPSHLAKAFDSKW